jgi:hypothetical protein
MSNTEEKNDQATSSNTSQIKVRCLVQQCLNATLQVKLADKENNIESEFVKVF